MSNDLTNFSVRELEIGLNAGDFSSLELVSNFRKDVGEKDKEVHAFLELFDDAEKQSETADEKIKKGEGGTLTGIPIALKDNILAEGRTVSAGSRMLENYTATYDSTVVKRLKDAGAVVFGRTNMDEFAMGSSTESSAFGLTFNPHDTTRVPGGSSGGSAAAVAMGAVPLALGSDTGGSIRQPASFCGCVGFKPTYGTVSRHGLIAMGSSLDQIGSFGRSVEDAKMLFDVIKGGDVMDSTSIPESHYGNEAIKKEMTIGVPRHFLKEGIDADVLEVFEKKLKQLETLGHTITEITLPNVAYSLAAYYIIMPAEASTNLARFDGVRFGLHKDGKDLIDDYKQSRGEGFGMEVRRRIMIGTYVLSSGYYDTYYGKALNARKQIVSDFNSAFESVDVIATPTTPTPAFKIGEKSDPLSMYLADVLTVPANITGDPAISIPMGTVGREGKELPLGIQLIAPRLCDKRLFALGKDVEKN